MKRILAAAFLTSAVAQAAPDLEVTKHVDVEVPAPGQPVEFSIDVRNIGPDPALDVHVLDELPTDLAIPAGMAPFASSGNFDPETGDWAVGDLAAGVGATLRIPVMVSVADPSDCIVNTAEATHEADENAANDRAMVAIRQPGIDRCVDVTARFFTITSTPDCGSRRTLSVVVDIINQGTTAANNVVATLAQDPLVAPNLRFTGSGCVGTRCILARLNGGETVRLLAVSDEFENPEPQPLRITVEASSDDTDFAVDNNTAVSDGTLREFTECPPIDVGGVGSTSGGGCFVATAAFGSRLDRHVVTLRHFRDEHLLQSAAGRAVVRLYYRYSPGAAAVISRNEGLRLAARGILAPLVLAIACPWRTLLITVLIVLALLAARRRSRRARFPS